MATKLKANEDLALEGDAPVQPVDVAMDSTEQIPIPPMPRDFPFPRRILVRELDFMPPIGGPIGFVRPDSWRVCPGPATIAQVINRIRNAGYDYQPDENHFYRPLDLNLTEPTCYVIRLNPRWNWRFSHKLKGATLGATVGTAQENYCNLKHVLDDDVGQDGPFPHERMCRIIYFFAKQPAAMPAAGFHHPFNLNVELVYPDGPAPEAVNTIPIVIDPDIRFPGGSGE